MPIRYPISQDPNVPGDGRPLQLGDVVVHTGAPTVRLLVASARPNQHTSLGSSQRQLIRVTVEDPHALDVNGFRGSEEGRWGDDSWQLVQRQTAVGQPAPALPQSLDPAVPGDGRPFVRGDIIRHTADPQNGTMDGQYLGPSPERGYITVGPAGSRSGHFTGSTWPDASFRLVHRLTAGESHRLPPALPSQGVEGQYPDKEFVGVLVDWLVSVSQGKVLISSIYAGHNANSPLSYEDGIHTIRLWMASLQPNSSPPDSARRDTQGYPNSYEYETGRMGDDVEFRRLLTRWLTTGMTRWFNRQDPVTKRCVACVTDDTVGEPCTHYFCQACGQSTKVPRCTICETLQAATHICSACCSHVECTEAGFEETMLKSAQCKTCKRNYNKCVCPGCEVPRCTNKSVQPCCGACLDHCNCASMCMTHTGMQKLYKFYPPAGEKGMTRLLGTEIETYSSTINQYTPALRKAVKLWQASIITDGSIGGKGVELVTQPAGGSQWRAMIADLGAGFAESKSRTSTSCGLHMHADCSDVDGFALKRIIQLYAHLEFCLYDALPIERQTGTYSKPNGAKLLTWLDNDAAKFDAKMEAGEAKRRLSYIQYGMVKPGAKMPRAGSTWEDSWGHPVMQTTTSVKTITSRWDDVVLQRTQGKSDPNRYSGLNMHSYWLRGTLEFRHHHGTNDPVKIVNWGFVVGSLVDYCVKAKDEDMAMILGLEPRLAMAMVLDGQPDVYEWLITRWAKFTSKHKTRLPEQPMRDEVTGEV